MRPRRHRAAPTARPLDEVEVDRLDALLDDYVATLSEAVLDRVAALLEATGRDPAPYLDDLRPEPSRLRYPGPALDDDEVALRRRIFRASLVAL